MYARIVHKKNTKRRSGKLYIGNSTQALEKLYKCGYDTQSNTNAGYALVCASSASLVNLRCLRLATAGKAFETVRR